MTDEYKIPRKQNLAESSYQICSKCILDSTISEISFDHNGVCNFCHDYESRITKDLYHNEEGRQKLDNLVSAIKKKGSKYNYDCLIGLSGGVDSTFVAYIVKKKYGLRPLAIHLDNGWNSELSVANIENIIKRLEIDLITKVLDWNVFRDLQISFMKSSISNIEIPTDHAIWAVLIHTAKEMNIPYIISGHNIVTESIMPDSWLYGSKDARLIKSIQREFGRYSLKDFPHLTLIDYVDLLLIRGIRWIPILNYFPYLKDEAKKIITNELGWRDYGGKHYESIFTRFFHSYYLPQKFGIDLRRSYLSVMILSGQMTREEALAEIKLPPASAELIQEDKEYVKKKLGLDDKEFKMIMTQPPKFYYDYSNNAFAWTRLSWFVRKARKWIIRVR